MSEQLEGYQQDMQQAASDVQWLAHLQDAARAAFLQHGFPTRKQEDWKYTPCDAWLKQPFKTTPARLVSHWETDAPAGAFRVGIVDGNVVGLEALQATLPAGVIVQPLLQAVAQHTDKLTPYLGKILEIQHGFHAMNLACLQTGLLIYVPKGVRWEEPLWICHQQHQEGQAVYLRHVVVMEANSQLTVVEDYHGENNTTYFTNTVMEVHLGTEATLTRYKVQREAQAAYHVGHVAVQQKAGSQFNDHSISLGGKLVRSDLSIQLQEPQAACLMNGVYRPREGQHVDHHTQVIHQVADCTSEQDYKGIVAGKARAVFNGQVIVLPGAQHTQAKQQNKNLLLSAHAEVDTKPQLEIFADDVVCTHGATVGQLDEDALFYLATRGIGREEASRFLVEAFTAENIRRVPHDTLAGWIGRLLQEAMK